MANIEDPPRRGDIAGQLDWLVRTVGSENDDGDGGQGLMGRLARLEARVSRLDTFLNRVLGGFAVIGAGAAIILLFFKVLIAAVVNGVR